MVPYGKGRLQFSVPPGMLIRQAASRPLKPVVNDGYPPGQQRAFVAADASERSNGIIVGSECPGIVSLQDDPRRDHAGSPEDRVRKVRLIVRCPDYTHALPAVPVVQEG